MKAFITAGTIHATTAQRTSMHLRVGPTRLKAIGPKFIRSSETNAPGSGQPEGGILAAKGLRLGRANGPGKVDGTFVPRGCCPVALRPSQGARPAHRRKPQRRQRRPRAVLQGPRGKVALTEDEFEVMSERASRIRSTSWSPPEIRLGEPERAIHIPIVGGKRTAPNATIEK